MVLIRGRTRMRKMTEMHRRKLAVIMAALLVLVALLMSTVPDGMADRSVVTPSSAFDSVSGV